MKSYNDQLQQPTEMSPSPPTDKPAPVVAPQPLPFFPQFGPLPQQGAPQAGLYLPVFHAIDANLATAIMRDINQALLTNPNLKKIYIPIANNGGDVAAALGIYEYLRSLKVEVTTHNVGSTDSSAIVVFAAGSRRIASRGSTFLFHPLRSMGAMNQPSLTDTREAEESLNRHTEQYIDIIVKNSDIKKTTVRKYLKETESLSAEKALAVKFIHEIKNLPDPLSILH